MGYIFNKLHELGKRFPFVIFTYVIRLGVNDAVPVEHEFFLRIPHCFPLLEHFDARNIQAQLNKFNDLDQSSSHETYPRLISLNLTCVHIDYVEQLLNGRKTHLPHLTELIADYDHLTIITEHFTSNATRSNCTQVKQLIIDRILAHSKNSTVIILCY